MKVGAPVHLLTPGSFFIVQLCQSVATDCDKPNSVYHPASGGKTVLASFSVKVKLSLMPLEQFLIDGSTLRLGRFPDAAEDIRSYVARIKTNRVG